VIKAGGVRSVRAASKAIVVMVILSNFQSDDTQTGAREVGGLFEQAFSTSS
jgi:hypothetical protein